MSNPWEEEEVQILAQYTYTVKSARALWLEMREAGYERTLKAVEAKLEKLGMRKPKRFKTGHEKVYGYFDIEASNLTANFGLMLGWCIKLRDGEIHHGIITKAELNSDTMDKALCQRLIDCIADNNVDVLVNFWGGPGRFDIPFVISRCEYHGLRWPGHGTLRHIDVHRLAKRVLRLSSYRLETVEKFFGYELKTHIKGPVWIKALQGDKEALDYILDHCKRDVKSLELVHKRLERYVAANSIIV